MYTTQILKKTRVFAEFLKNWVQTLDWLIFFCRKAQDALYRCLWEYNINMYLDIKQALAMIKYSLPLGQVLRSFGIVI